MPSSHLDLILRELSWNTNFSVPIASTGNHALECEIQEKEEELEQTQKCLAENEERISILSEHRKDVEHELHHTMYLLQARKKELATEEHMTTLAKQLKERFQHDIVKVDKEFEKFKECGNFLKNTLFHRKEKFSRVKSRLNWDAETLEAWLVECKQREEDLMFINKFSSQDEAEVKELNIKLKRMSDELNRLQKSQERENIEAMSLEIELDKTAEDFRRMHADRSHLISRWEQMLKQMLAKDYHIQFNAMKLFDASEEARELKRLLKQKENLFNMLVEDNANIQMRTNATAKQTGSLTLDLQTQEKLRGEFQAELKALVMTVVATSGTLNHTRSETLQLGISVDKKTSELQTTRKKCDRLRQRLSVIEESAVSAEEEMKQLNELFVEDSNSAHALLQELEELRTKRYQAANDRQEKLMEEQRLTMETGKASGLLKKLNSHLRAISDIDVKQQKVLHNTEIQWNESNWRMDRMKGELSSQTEKVAAETKTRELTKELKMYTDTRQLLEKQQRRQQVEFNTIHQAMKQLSSEKSRIVNKLKELDLSLHDAKRELEKLTTARQDLLVELNIHELKVQCKRQRLSRRASGVDLLEFDRMAMEAAIKERLLDISNQQTVLRQSIRMVEKERQKIVFQFHEKANQIERMKNRFELSLIPFAPKSDDHDAARMNYFIMKVVLEKEELQREGDLLDARIRKASKELEALKNTVAILNYQNSAARQSLRPVAKDGEAMGVKEQLERELRGLITKLKQKQKQVHDIKTDYQVICQTTADLRHEKETLATTIKEKKIKFCQVKKDFDCCEGKLQRADQLLIRLSREIRAGAKIIHKLPEEMDIDIRELRELNKNAIQKMNEVIEKHPEMAAAVKERLLRASIPISSHSSSSRSSCSSRSSNLSTRSCQEGPTQPPLPGVRKSSSVTGRSSSSSKSSSSKSSS